MQFQKVATAACLLATSAMEPARADSKFSVDMSQIPNAAIIRCTDPRQVISVQWGPQLSSEDPKKSNFVFVCKNPTKQSAPKKPKAQSSKPMTPAQS